MFSLYFYPALLLYSLAVIPLLALTVTVRAPFVPHRASMRSFRRMISRYGYGIIRGLARPAVRVVYETDGTARALAQDVAPGAAPAADDPAATASTLPQAAAGARIFVANHVAASDPFLMAVLPEEVVQVVNLWPFKLPVWGIFARWAGYLNIRAMGAAAFQQQAARLLAQGSSIVAFPEGTRAGAGPVGPFHGAMFRLALATRAPLVPLCITGNEATPARGSLLLMPTTIRVRRLAEIAWKTFADQTPFQLKNQVQQIISREVAAMRQSL